MTRKLYTLCGADTDRHFSPHAWKAEMALRHKGLAFDAVPTSFTKIPQIENGASRTVPLLVDGDRTVGDSFAIAEYLEEAYPDAPSLFGGPGGKAAARFIERWSLANVQAPMMPVIILDIYDKLAAEDQAYFRESREARLGKTLEDVAAGGDAALAAYPARLEPLRQTLSFQPFLGGETPLFSDYIVFGGLQWARVASGVTLLAQDDPVSAWFERCLDLFDGAGRKVPAAA
ncbi:glutathione S-transferase family protein [Pseudohoeflea suaedae]|uniref:Glutathione S-transferase family protein n=1 Tax=Pseudohoeflea suaedae TaxID=877384 RepID=A0A4R5PP95_9HYPH|nr:glutathione S-transferase family protein [Pseudohoeflea suaedae]TDH38904.1 glutathione S-transferase family protein [Pseudohoeflea suaedae]